MSSKVYKGAGVVVEGSNSGDHPFITKLAYNCSALVEYIGECKYGVLDVQPKHYIEKITYNCTLNPDRILISQNQINANATEVSITTDALYVYINLTSGNGDFLDVHTDDSIYLKTPTQEINNHPVIKVSETQLQIRKDASLVSIVDEPNAVITVWDMLLTLKHKDTKDFDTRRWSARERYIYS